MVYTLGRCAEDSSLVLHQLKIALSAIECVTAHIIVCKCDDVERFAMCLYNEHLRTNHPVFVYHKREFA